MAHGFYNIDDRNYGFSHSSFPETTGNHFLRYERTNTVMHPHHTTDTVYQSQSVFNRVETGFTSIGNFMPDVKSMRFTQFPPKPLLFPGQYENKLHSLIESMKSFQRMHQYRLSANGKKLFGKFTSHAESLPPGYNQSSPIHRLNVLRTWPLPARLLFPCLTMYLQ